ncbi:MAG: TVP38/TMEM64 family protein [Marinicaulis sp.]|nr:TVP38/TMEM64 family protein [Marinicaulis sp.]
MTDQKPPNQRQGPNQRHGIVKRAAPIALILVGLALFFAFGLNRYFSLDALRDNRDALRMWVEAFPFLAMGIFLLIYAGAVTISFPGASILTVFGGFLFGLWPGVPIIVTAATLGATVIFLASKTALNGALGNRASGFVTRMEKGFREDELSYMFLLRLVPVFPFWAINIAAGVIGVSLRNFLIGTSIGIIPGTFVYASIGHAANKAFDAGKDISLAGLLFKPETLLPIIGLAILATIPIVLKRFSKQAAHMDDQSS